MSMRTVESATKCLADQASVVFPKLVQRPALSLGELRAAARPEAEVLAKIWPPLGRAARDRCNVRAVRRTIQRAYNLPLDD
mgnify:CR=1